MAAGGMGVKFNILLEWNEDGGGYTVIVPSLPGCITEGDTWNEALANAREAIEGYLEVLRMKGQPVPESDSKASLAEIEVSATA